MCIHMSVPMSIFVNVFANCVCMRLQPFVHHHKWSNLNFINKSNEWMHILRNHPWSNYTWFYIINQHFITVIVIKLLIFPMNKLCLLFYVFFFSSFLFTFLCLSFVPFEYHLNISTNDIKSGLAIRFRRNQSIDCFDIWSIRRQARIIFFL